MKTRSVGTNTHAVSDPQEQKEPWEIPDFPGAIDISSQLWRDVWSLAGSAISILMSHDTADVSSIQIPDLNGQALKDLVSSIQQQASFLSSGICNWDLCRKSISVIWRSLQKRNTPEPLAQAMRLPWCQSWVDIMKQKSLMILCQIQVSESCHEGMFDSCHAFAIQIAM